MNDQCDNDLRKMVIEARDAILARKLFQPQVALILGSGLGELAGHMEYATAIPVASIPHFSHPRATGHAGQLLLGFLAGLPVVVLQGRCHRYEGFANSQVSFPVYCMQALGASTLITTNAAGGLNRRFRTGDLMVIDNHIDQLWPGPRARTADAVSAQGGSNSAARQFCLTPPYDRNLIERVKTIARRQNVVLHQGCYLATLGPTYETRSEYRMFRWMGADAVGMSTIPEIRAAAASHMNSLAFSVITNVASTDIPQSTTHDEVVTAGTLAGPRLMRIVRELLETMSGQPD